MLFLRLSWSSHFSRLPLAVLAAAWLLLAMQSNAAIAGEIYTCVDSQGRKITADRPIAECMDRQQLQLNKSGTVKSKVMPVPTAQEKAAQELKERQIAEANQLETDEKRRNRALTLRYPSQAVHDKERNTALAMVDEVILSAHKRIQALAVDRKAIDNQLEFYVSNPARIPPALKRSVDENQANALEQQKFIAAQGNEKKRVNLRFDTELAQLRIFWAAAATGGGGGSGGANAATGVATKAAAPTSPAPATAATGSAY